VASRKTLFGLLFGFFRIDTGNQIASRLAKRVITISIAFLLMSSFVPLYQFTEGYQLEGDYGIVELTDQEAGSALDNMMTEDGFILKPALNSEQGDRTTANEIFAYEVEPGDTLSSIAQQFGIKKETLVMENDLWNVSSLRSGMMLKILPVDGISHLIQKGDTVDKIAKKYSIDKETIIKQNQLEDSAELLAGNAIIIPGGKKSAPVYAYTNSYTAPSSAAGYQYTGPSTGRLIWPTLGKAKLTQGYRSGHYAIDIGNRDKGPIFAAAAGKIITASYGWNGGYGNYIIIDHGNGMQTLYAHNEKLYVTEGQYVEQGQTISWMGNTGRVYGATGIHLHFEVRINGVKYNPMNFF
jgi:murein DD-endopeptidase MepM/ murein hydrolase activator NlpD